MPRRNVDTINRKELVTLVQRKLHQYNQDKDRPIELTDGRLEALMTLLFDTIKEAVCNDKEIRLRDFGTFKVIPVKARKNHLPGRFNTSPATTKIKFQPCIGWKNQVGKTNSTPELAAV